VVGNVSDRSNFCHFTKLRVQNSVFLYTTILTILSFLAVFSRDPFSKNLFPTLQIHLIFSFKGNYRSSRIVCIVGNLWRAVDCWCQKSTSQQALIREKWVVQKFNFRLFPLRKLSCRAQSQKTKYCCGWLKDKTQEHLIVLKRRSTCSDVDDEMLEDTKALTTTADSNLCKALCDKIRRVSRKAIQLALLRSGQHSSYLCLL